MKAAASRKRTTGAVRSTTRKKAAKRSARATVTLAVAKRTVKGRTSKPKASKATARKSASKKPALKKAASRSPKATTTAKKKVRVTAKSARSRTPVRRARTSTPARATHPKKAVPSSRRRAPIPSPLPTRHVAPERATLLAPARSMPPAKVERRPVAVPAPPPPVVLPEFSEAGVLLAITYSIRDGRRGEFFDLMRELKPLLTSIGGTDVSVYEDRSRPNYLMEVFRFKDEAEFTAFDDKFHKDRKIAAIYALLDDIVEAEKSDFKIFERRL